MLPGTDDVFRLFSFFRFMFYSILIKYFDFFSNQPYDQRIINIILTLYTETMQIDAVNIEIIRHLKDGRKSYKLIAQELSITENTVRARVNKMIEDGILEISGNVRVDVLRGHSLLYLGVKLKTMDLQEKAKEFSQLRGVVSAGIVTGRYDLILQVLLSEEYNLLEFITGQVAKIQDVQTVESFVVYEGYNLKVPYIL